MPQTCSSHNQIPRRKEQFCLSIWSGHISRSFFTHFSLSPAQVQSTANVLPLPSKHNLIAACGRLRDYSTTILTSFPEMLLPVAEFFICALLNSGAVLWFALAHASLTTAPVPDGSYFVSPGLKVKMTWIRDTGDPWSPQYFSTKQTFVDLCHWDTGGSFVMAVYNLLWLIQTISHHLYCDHNSPSLRQP